MTGNGPLPGINSKTCAGAIGLSPASSSSRESHVPAAEKEQRKVLFSGVVQGVGFRVTTERLAAGHLVVGTVRNLRDGRVELVAEGLPAEIDRFLDRVRERFRGNIREETTSTSRATHQFTSFDVTR